jgi:hypothetical protein
LRSSLQHLFGFNDYFNRHDCGSNAFIAFVAVCRLISKEDDDDDDSALGARNPTRIV